MRIDRLLIKEYQQQLEQDLKSISGQNDIELLLKAFEEQFARYIGVRHALAVNSGTDALQMALLTLGIGRGDSVIIPDVTYPAVPLSILYVGAEPIIVDVKANDLQIDEEEIARAIHKTTKAIIAPHMFARPCAIEKIMTIARHHGLKVIEDCCQAESSTMNGRKLGSFADMSCFSFSYYKPLSSCGGGGGMVCFNDSAYRSAIELTRIWADQETLLRAGQRFSRMNLLDLIAVKAKWKYLKDIIRSRLQIKDLYETKLLACKQVHFFIDPPGAISVPQNFVIMTGQRDKLGDDLQKNGVVWQRPYTPLHMMKIFKRYAKGAFPNSKAYMAKAIQLPLYSFMKKEEAVWIIETVKAAGAARVTNKN
jgi:dTDP-4-amino-4,6-dideoxygalactose transaminase